MSMRFKGGIISATPPTTTGGESGTASGAWTLQQQMQAQAAGNWPVPTIQGGLWVVGFNNNGQLGQNDLVARSSPVQVGSDSTWSKIAINSGSQSKILAIKTNGTLWAWGSNLYGMLGLSNTTNYSSPKQVGALTTWSNPGSCLASGFAVKTDGTLWSWGYNHRGELGQNISYTVNKSSPVQVGTDTNWSKVVGGDESVFAIKTNGTLWSWGGNGEGQLGQNDRVSRSSPTQIGSDTNWSKIAIGSNNPVIAIKTNGTMWSWGRNYNGALGQGDTIYRSSPVQIGALSTWSDVSCGTLHAIALKTDGTIWAWGYNNFGQLGQGNTTNLSSPVQVGALTTWTAVVAGNGNSGAVNNGALWTWGANTRGQLGLSNTTAYSSPKQVGSATNWTKNLTFANNSFLAAIRT